MEYVIKAKDLTTQIESLVDENLNNLKVSSNVTSQEEILSKTKEEILATLKICYSTNRYDGKNKIEVVKSLLESLELLERIKMLNVPSES